MLRAGWNLAWRRQRLLWWIYLVSLGLSFLASQPLVTSIGPILDHSLVADRLYHSLDLATLADLVARPEINTTALGGVPVLVAAVFLVLMLLFTGGILKVYEEDRTFTTGEFFGAGGQFFWPFVRLAIFLLIVLVPVALLNWGFRAWSGNLSDHFAQPAPHVAVNIAGELLVLFLVMVLRLWFDMAEVESVAEGEYAMRRSVVRAFRLIRNHLRSLFWLFSAPIATAALGTGAIFWIWVRWVPHQAVTASFLLSQLVILLWIFARLWQRSIEVLWRRQNVSLAGAVPQAPLPDLGSAIEAPPALETPPAEISL